MKKEFLFYLFLFLGILSYGQDFEKALPGSCACQSDGLINITSANNGVVNLTTSASQAYFWKVCSGNAQISGTNTSQNVSIQYNGSPSVITVTRFQNGNCSTSCIILNNDNSDYPDPEDPDPGCEIEFIQFQCAFEGIEFRRSRFKVSCDGQQEYADWRLGGVIPPNDTDTYNFIGRNNSMTMSFWPKSGSGVGSFSGRVKAYEPGTNNLLAELYVDLVVCDEGLNKDTNNEYDNTISVAPNPANTIINFNGRNLNDYKLTIFNINGDILLERNNINESINIEHLKKGIYNYVIQNDSGEKQVGKIVKK